MNLKDVKKELNHVVYYDTGQLNIDGSSLRDFILSACILRRDKKKHFYYQAKLQDTVCKRSVMIVPLEKVLSRDEV